MTNWEVKKRFYRTFFYLSNLAKISATITRLSTARSTCWLCSKRANILRLSSIAKPRISFSTTCKNQERYRLQCRYCTHFQKWASQGEKRHRLYSWWIDCRWMNITTSSHEQNGNRMVKAGWSGGSWCSWTSAIGTTNTHSSTQPTSDRGQLRYPGKKV